MSRHNPGQPLPFKIVENNYGSMFVVDGSNDGESTYTGRVFRSAKAPKRLKTTKYLVHAANNYPALVHALQSEAEAVYAILCSDGGGDIPARIIAAQDHVARWRGLLKRIGESR